MNHKFIELTYSQNKKKISVNVDYIVSVEVDNNTCFIKLSQTSDSAFINGIVESYEEVMDLIRS